MSAGSLGTSGPTVIALKRAHEKLGMEDDRITLRELKALLIREGLRSPDAGFSFQAYTPIAGLAESCTLVSHASCVNA